jgi:hypothetical protein
MNVWFQVGWGKRGEWHTLARLSSMTIPQFEGFKKEFDKYAFVEKK